MRTFVAFALVLKFCLAQAWCTQCDPNKCCADGTCCCNTKPGCKEARDVSSIPVSSDQASFDPQFDDFKRKFGRRYANADEEKRRRNIFKENLAFIALENSKGHSYTLGVTNFADLTYEEWRSQYLGGFRKPTVNASLSVFRAPVGFVEDASVDWVSKGAVTPVKDQAHCGSCWTFSTTGALEGAAFIAGRGLTSLSEQNILDCDHGGNKCVGGSMPQAFGWVAENGLFSENDDPYKCADQDSYECTNSQCPTSGTKVLAVGDVTGYTNVDQTEGALEAAVAKQPVSVAIEADQAVFQHYTSGILTDDACGETLDHGVLVVGYGSENGQKYWKVKNSWGTNHGDAGYWRIGKGEADTGGECGIRKMASFPTVSGSGPAPPPPSPPSPPSPPTPSAYHYEEPPSCQSDEVAMQVKTQYQGNGDVCASRCDNDAACPTDVPPGTKATPFCFLKDQDGSMRCALRCGFTSGCPSGAACKLVNWVGVCVYPATSATQKEIVV